MSGLHSSILGSGAATFIHALELLHSTVTHNVTYPNVGGSIHSREMPCGFLLSGVQFVDEGQLVVVVMAPQNRVAVIASHHNTTLCHKLARKIWQVLVLHRCLSRARTAGIVRQCAYVSYFSPLVMFITVMLESCPTYTILSPDGEKDTSCTQPPTIMN